MNRFKPFLRELIPPFMLKAIRGTQNTDILVITPPGKILNESLLDTALI